MKNIFDHERDELKAFVKSDEYFPFVEAKIQRVAENFKDSKSIMYVSLDDFKNKDAFVKAFGTDIEVQASDDIQIGGFILENKASSLVVDETLDFALNNQREWFNKNSGLIIR